MITKLLDYQESSPKNFYTLLLIFSIVVVVLNPMVMYLLYNVFNGGGFILTVTGITVMVLSVIGFMTSYKKLQYGRFDD